MLHLYICEIAAWERSSWVAAVEADCSFFPLGKWDFERCSASQPKDLQRTKIRAKTLIAQKARSQLLGGGAGAKKSALPWLEKVSQMQIAIYLIWPNCILASIFGNNLSVVAAKDTELQEKIGQQNVFNFI